MQNVSVARRYARTFSFYCNVVMPGAFIQNIISTTDASQVGFCHFEPGSNFYDVIFDNTSDICMMLSTIIRTGGSLDTAIIYSISFSSNSINYRVTGNIYSVSGAEGLYVDDKFHDVTPLLGGPIDCNVAVSSNILTISDIGGKNIIVHLYSPSGHSINQILVNENVRKIRFYADSAPITFTHGSTLSINGGSPAVVASPLNYIEISFNDPNPSDPPYESGRLTF
jgi:hypothetical protein